MTKVPLTEEELIDLVKYYLGDDEQEEKQEEQEEQEEQEKIVQKLVLDIEIPEPPVLERKHARNYSYDWFFTPTARAMARMDKEMLKPQHICSLHTSVFSEKKRKAPSVHIIGPHSDTMSTPPNHLGFVVTQKGISIFKNKRSNSERSLKKRRFRLLETDEETTTSFTRTLFCEQ